MNGQLIIGQGRLTTPAIYEDIKEPKKLKKEVTSMSYQNSKQNLKDDDLIQKADKILQEAIANKRKSVLFSKKEYSQSDLAKLGQVLPRLGYDVTATYNWHQIVGQSVNLTNYGNIQHGILHAYWTQAGIDDKEYHIELGPGKVLQNDVDFVIVQLLYNSVKKYVALQGQEVNRDTFNKGIHEYIGNGAVAVHVGALYDLRHPDEVDD